MKKFGRGCSKVSCIFGADTFSSMANQDKKPQTTSLLGQLKESDNPVVSFARDIIWVVAVVAIVGILLFVVSGTWPAVVAVESESMVPNMQVGDLT